MHFTFSKDEVFTEGLKALYGPDHAIRMSEKSGAFEKGKSEESQKQQQQSSGTGSDDGNGELILPHFCDMAQYLAERAALRMQSAASRHVIGNHALPFSPASFVEVSHFSCLAVEISSSYLGVIIRKVNKSVRDRFNLRSLNS
jgi:hypothetical protein